MSVCSPFSCTYIRFIRSSYSVAACLCAYRLPAGLLVCLLGKYVCLLSCLSVCVPVYLLVVLSAFCLMWLSRVVTYHRSI